jgi:hypothetical protein
MPLLSTFGSFSIRTVVEPAMAITAAIIRVHSRCPVCCTMMPPNAHAAALLMYITTVAVSMMTVNSLARFSSRSVS